VQGAAGEPGAEERIAIDALGEELERRLRAPWRSPKLED